MREPRQIYDMFSALLGYPGDGDGATTAEFGEVLACEGGGVAACIGSFFDQTRGLSPGEREELYTRTFDINPVASLELGWHLYGEQYERGAFLVKMRQQLHRHFVEEAVELPDHLTHVLLLLGRLDKQEADVFAATYLLPSLDKILAGFAEVENPYKSLLQGLRAFAQAEHRAQAHTILEGAVHHD